MIRDNRGFFDASWQSKSGVENKDSEFPDREFSTRFVIDMNEIPETFYSFMKRINTYDLISPVGDIAKVIINDRSFPKGRKTYEDYLSYLDQFSPPSNIMESYEKAYMLYICQIL